MTWETMTPRERDALVGTKVLGREPRITWIATNDGGHSSCASTSTRGPWRDRGDLAEWLEAQQAKGYHGDYEISQWESHPRYTEDFAYAWEVVEAREAAGWRMVLQNGVQHPEYTWRVDFHDNANARPFVRDGHHVAGGSSAADAICRCALRAMGVEV